MAYAPVTSEDLELFRRILVESDFPHRDEVLRQIEENPWEVLKSDGAVPVRSLLEVYQIRLHLAEKNARQTPHALQILNSMRDFVDKLKRSEQNDVTVSWDILVDDASSFDVFVAQKQEKVLGCFFTIDKRFVAPDRWEELWGPDV